MCGRKEGLGVSVLVLVLLPESVRIATTDGLVQSRG